MISLIAAIGERGEYGGDKNGLPWHCPTELELFWENLAMLTAGSHALLVGAGTWFSFPEVLRQRIYGILLASQCLRVVIYDPKDKFRVETKAIADVYTPTHGIQFTRLLSITSLYNTMPMVCIGGARLIKTLIDNGMLGRAYISRMKVDEEHADFPALSRACIEEREKGRWKELYDLGLNQAGSEFGKKAQEISQYISSLYDDRERALRDIIKANKHVTALTLPCMKRQHYSYGEDSVADQATIICDNTNTRTSDVTGTPLYFTGEIWYFND